MHASARLLARTALALSLAPFASAQIPADAFSLKLDGGAHEWVLASANDEAGNRYVVGATTSSDLASTRHLDADGDGAAEAQAPESLVATGPGYQGGTDLFVAKYNHEGALVWAQQAGGAGDDAATGIAVDPDGNVFVSGYIAGSATFGSQIVSATAGSGGVASTATNLFVARLDASGFWQNVTPMPLRGEVRKGPEPTATLVTGQTLSGVRLVTGRLDSRSASGHLVGRSLALAPQSTSQLGAGEQIFYLKGEFIDTQITGATPATGETWTCRLGLNAASAPAHEVSRLSLVDGVGAISSHTGAWAFVTRITYRAAPVGSQTTWTWDWMQPVSTTRASTDHSSITQIVAGEQPSSPVYFSGFWQGVFQAGASHNSGGKSAGFVGALNPDGTSAFLARITGEATANTLVPDGAGGLLVAGNLYNKQAASFAPRSGGGTLSLTPTQTGSFNTAPFLARLSSSGAFVWAQTSTGPGEATAQSLVRKPSGEVFLGGAFAGTVSLGSNARALFSGSVPPPARAAYAARLTLESSGARVDWARESRSSSSGSPEVHTALLDLNALQTLHWHVASGGRTLIEPRGSGLAAKYYKSDFVPVTTQTVNAAFGLTARIRAEHNGVVQTQAASPDGNTFVFPGVTIWFPAASFSSLNPTATLVAPTGHQYPLTPNLNTPYRNFFYDTTLDVSTHAIPRDGAPWTLRIVNRTSSRTDYGVTAQLYWDTNNGYGSNLLFLRVDSNSTQIGGASILAGQTYAPTYAPPTVLGPTAPFTGPVQMTRIDGPIDFNWGTGSPVGQNDYFSVEWTGWLVAPETGVFRLVPEGDNASLSLDGVTLGSAASKLVSLVAGQAYALRFVIEDRAGSAMAKLSWVPPSRTAPELIPATALFPDQPFLPPTLDSIRLSSRGTTDTVIRSGVVQFTLRPSDGRLEREFLHWQEFIVGDQLTRPPGTHVGATLPFVTYPAGVSTGQGTPVLRSTYDFEHYAAGAIRARLLFPLTSDQSVLKPRREGLAAAIRWPASRAEGLVEYIHGDGIPAVDLAPAGSSLEFSQLQYVPASPASVTVSAKLLQTSADGYATLHFTPAGVALGQTVPILRAVLARHWTQRLDSAAATIGATIDPPTDALAETVGGRPRTGHTIRPRARYDAAPAVYDRAARLGQIIPVNLANPSVPAEQLDVAWYRRYDGTPVDPSAHVFEVVKGGPAADEVQRVELREAASGTFTLSFTRSGDTTRTTPPLPFDATGAVIAAAFADLYGDGPAVSGPAGGPWLVYIGNEDMNTDGIDLPALEIDASGLNPHTADLSGRIVWPFRAVNYTASWPTSATTPALERLTVASELGSEGKGADGVSQLHFNPATQLDLAIYHQPDRTLPGFNPNEEHALVLRAQGAGTSRDVVFALRNDLNHRPLGTTTSEPRVLARYRDAADGDRWKYRVFEVLVTDPVHYPDFALDAGLAGGAVRAIYPLSLPGLTSTETRGEGLPFFIDKNGEVWAKAAGTLTARYHYRLQNGFWFDADGDGVQDPGADSVPWLAGGHHGTPRPLVYSIGWPLDVPTLRIGDTLTLPRDGLPGVYGMQSVEIIYDENDPSTSDPANPTGESPDKAERASVRLYDFVVPRRHLPAGATVQALGTELRLLPPGGGAPIVLPAVLTPGNLYEFPTLPADLRPRFHYDPTAGAFAFRGLPPDTSVAGEPVLLPNFFNRREAALLALLDDPSGEEPPEPSLWDELVEELRVIALNPELIDRDPVSGPDDALYLGLAPGSGSGETQKLRHARVAGGAALSAAFAPGAGYVTLVENNDPALVGAPVNVHLIRIVDEPVSGQLHVFENENKLDERLVLRHRGDFGGRADELTFEWWWAPVESVDGAVTYPPLDATAPDGPGAGWLRLASGTGLNAFTLRSGLEVLSDGWIVSRYRGLETENTKPDDFHGYAGDPLGTPADPVPLLAQGWIKRVLEGIDPFEQRYRDFHATAAQTYVSMIEQAGPPYVGDVALNGSDGDYLNSIGLLELYRTVQNRGLALSLEANPPLAGPSAVAAGVMDQLLLAATRSADLHLLLANEAYADAQDPTIGFTTTSAEGYLAPSRHAFGGLSAVPSLLEEELALLRGREIAGRPPFPLYNRLPWNFNTDGEPIYNTAYALVDRDGDGDIDATDARRAYPQGHGDAWGHYLSALKEHYRLLLHPHFTWQNRTQVTTIGGTAIGVDYRSEAKFAQAALGLARAGLEITDLTHRQRYTGDPAFQWLGYRDPNTTRAWGVDEWARRTGQAAVVNWIVGQAILPVADATNESLAAKVDRPSVPELRGLATVLAELESRVSLIDRGLNPLGIDSHATPFDINPTLAADGGIDARSHFEQVHDRALEATHNALELFDHANEQTRRIRQNSLDASAFQLQLDQQELDLRSRLIEIFGYPHVGDIGPGKTYPTGYDGPDLLHFMYMPATDFAGTLPESEYSEVEIGFTAFLDSIDESDASAFNLLFDSDLADSTDAADFLDVNPDATFDVVYPYVSIADYGALAPDSWGRRRAPGELQLALMQALQLQTKIRQSQAAHRALIQKTEDQIDLLASLYDVRAEQIRIMDENGEEFERLNDSATRQRASSAVLNGMSETIYRSVKVMGEALPQSFIAGLAAGGDTLSPLRIVAGTVGLLTVGGLELSATVREEAAIQAEGDRTLLAFQTPFTINKAGYAYEVAQHLTHIEGLLRDEPALRFQISQDVQALETAFARYQSLLGRGQRLLDERVLLRRQAAGTTQQRRYQDMTFRLFRNDALQKYRASFDLAARYTYLAARVFDYETALLADDSGAGWRYYDDIVRQRALGAFTSSGTPLAGSTGLSQPLAALASTYAAVKTAYGFNNPQFETNRFSLRREALRIRSEPADDPAWRSALRSALVPDVWALPEFRRHARPPRAESDGPLPALVLPFETAIASSVNHFGWPHGGADSSYDSSRFATRVSSVGVWFENYDALGLSNTPRVYLIPVGLDVVRSPSPLDFDTREFVVFDEAIPVPDALDGAFRTDAGWIPANDSVSEPWDTARRFPRFRAYHDSGFDPAQLATDTRLIGRSVWNTRWLLIITGDTFLADPRAGLERFIHGTAGSGVSDIKLIFETYSHSGGN